MALVINFVSINVNAVNRNATISIGEANQAGWSSHTKNNFGNGLYIGISVLANNLTTIIDSDVIDSPIIDMDFLPSVQNQQA